MKAIVQDVYGPPDVLELREIDRPTAGEGQVLIEVKAASLNIYDMHMTTGRPYMARAVAGWLAPKNKIPGADVAGVVAEIGPGVSRFSVGDEIFGAHSPSTPSLRRSRWRTSPHLSASNSLPPCPLPV
jgi:NADPH:quinone reductase-like Zn-dependent oxidoreductase